jgi:hypothetical protein
MSPRFTKGRKRVNIYSFSLPGELEPEINAMDKLARTEGKSRGDIILAAWREYAKIHCPGNPQPPLMAQSDEPTEFNQISLGFMRHTLKSDIARMEDPKILDKHFIKARLEKSLLKAAKVYDRTQDPELGDLIKRAREILNV